MKTKIIAILLCMVALASCSKDDIGTPPAPDGTQAAIVPMAGVGMSATPTARASLSGPVKGTTFPVSTENLFAVTAYKDQAPTSDYAGAYFDNKAVNSDSKGNLNFSDAQYYPADAQPLYFYAYSPVTAAYASGSGTDSPTATWENLTGQEDIMYASVTTGIGKADAGVDQPQPAFEFRHKLKQIRFKLVQGVGFGDYIPARRISIMNCKTKASLDLITGELTFSGAAAPINLEGEFYIYEEDEAEEIAPVLLCEPGEDLVIEVLAEGLIYKTSFKLTGNNAGGAGVSHLVTLTFVGTTIEPEVTIVDWIDVGEAEGTIK